MEEDTWTKHAQKVELFCLTLVCPALYTGGVRDVTIKESWVLAVGVGFAFNTYIG